MQSRVPSKERRLWNQTVLSWNPNLPDSLWSLGVDMTHLWGVLPCLGSRDDDNIFLVEFLNIRDDLQKSTWYLLKQTTVSWTSIILWLHKLIRLLLITFWSVSLGYLFGTGTVFASLWHFIFFSVAVNHFHIAYQLSLHEMHFHSWRQESWNWHSLNQG